MAGRGSKPGEHRGGRKVGTPNKATAEIKVIAQQYSEEAMAELARLASAAESEAARVAAIKEILDRAYGKAPQSLDLNHDMSDRLADLMQAVNGRSRGLPTGG